MRKRYTVPAGRLLEMGQHAHPERTAYREYSPGGRFTGDDECCVFPSRSAMLEAVRMSQRGEHPNKYWRPLVK